MYKIMTKLHTATDNIYAFYTVKNDNGETVEYTVNTPEEAAEQALEILKRVGYADLRIVDDKSYYLDLIYGEKPIPEPNLYTLEMICPAGVVCDPMKIEDIKENETVNTHIALDHIVDGFHLIIDGKEYKTGLPKWVTYDEINDTEGILTFSGITRDHIVEIELDELYSI